MKSSSQSIRIGFQIQEQATGEYAVYASTHPVMVTCCRALGYAENRDNGLGAVSSSPGDGAAGNGEPTMAMPEVLIAGLQTIVSFSGLAPGFVGLYQINVEVPAGLSAGNQPVVVTVADVSSNSILLPVE